MVTMMWCRGEHFVRTMRRHYVRPEKLKYYYRTISPQILICIYIYIYKYYSTRRPRFTRYDNARSVLWRAPTRAYDNNMYYVNSYKVLPATRCNAHRVHTVLYCGTWTPGARLVLQNSLAEKYCHRLEWIRWWTHSSNLPHAIRTAFVYERSFG